jgi:aminoglycoside 6'-N-acetyltransferase I
MVDVHIRPAIERDVEGLARMCAFLWPDGSVDEHWREVHAKIRYGKSGSLPLALFVAEEMTGVPCGFIEVGLRSHADACDTKHSVGYIEG